jgi:hypothetical protein
MGKDWNLWYLDVEIGMPAHVNDEYMLPGLPRVDRANRRLEWGKLLKRTDSAWTDYAYVGCNEPILYVVFCDRPLPHPNQDAYWEYHTWNFVYQVCDRMCSFVKRSEYCI